jgi:PAS domain S-box-containing protein
MHMDNTPVAALEWDADTRIIRWSPAAERMFGWTEAEVLGQTLAALGLVHEDDGAQVAQVVEALLADGMDRNYSLNRNHRKDGGVIWCAWYNSVLRDERGALVSVLSLAMDVTDRQAMEASLRLQAEQLAETDRRKNEFLAMLGHELRSPLAPLRNALALMATKGDDKDRMQWARDMIERQAQHLERLVDDLLDVARITRGSIRLQMAPVRAAAS